MPFPRMAWVGLLIATLGWGILICYPLVVSLTVDTAQNTRDPARFIPLLGENTILTGMAIAVLGTLEKAIRLLTKIAGQNALPKSQSLAAKAVPAVGGAAGTTQLYPAHGETMLMSQRGPNDVVTRGALNGRDYVLFRDGSVVLETLLGPRRFASITEAQEFIGMK
jgi:hypothetical protein